MDIDLTICQICKVNPAVYGDGITWSRCSKCQLEHLKSEDKVPEVQAPVSEDGFPHEIVPGLVSIILPVYMTNYTLFHYTGNCIGSIREHTPKDSFELVVVDNGSPLQPPSELSYYAHRVIKNSENFGVTKSWNQGIRMSVGEYIVLINNDVQVFDGWLEDMKEALDKDGYDLVMAHPMYSLTEPFARAVESRIIREKPRSGFDKYSDFKDFSCIMFKRTLLDEIGLFDERFFNYCSDSDFFKRLEDSGKKWACCEHVPTSHISDATGYSISETPKIMDEDKKRYEEKYDPVKSDFVNVVNNNSDKFLMRVKDGGDPLYLVDGKKIHHIKDPDTLHALGFDFGQEILMTKDELKEFEFSDELGMDNYQTHV